MAAHITEIIIVILLGMAKRMRDHIRPRRPCREWEIVTDVGQQLKREQVKGRDIQRSKREWLGN